MLFRRVVVILSAHQHKQPNNVIIKRGKSSIITNNNASIQHFDDIPSPKGLPFIGTTLSIIANGSTPNLHNYIDKRHKQFGPIFKESLGPVNAVFVADAQEIRAVFAQEGKYPVHVLPDPWIVYNQKYGCRRGLFFMDGPNWAHHRKIMNKLLLKSGPADDHEWITDACECVSEKLIEKIKNSLGANCELDDVEGIFYKWSLEVIVAILLGPKEYKSRGNELEEELGKLASKIHLVFETTAKLSLIPAAFAAKLRIPQWKRFVRSVDEALDGANSLVGRLSVDLDANSEGLLAKLLKEDIDPDNVKRIIADLILAAGDTTAYAVQWMLYSIGKNKRVQEELRHNNELIRNVLRETLRLYPVAPFLTRILPNTSQICGYEIPKNNLIVLSIYSTGRDEKYYINPLEFEPNRWNRHSNKEYHVDMQRASLPFAMGLRSCIGKKIAETQLQNTILKIVNNFNVDVGNERDVEVVLKMVAVPSEAIRFKFKPI